MNGRVAAFFGSLHFLSALYGVIIEPRPTADIKENDNLTLTCRQVDAGWTSISFVDGTVNMAYIRMQDGKCVDYEHKHTVNCSVSLQEFYLTINSVTVAGYHGHNITCLWYNGTFINSITSSTIINVQFPPTSSPNISQTPSGPIIEGHNVSLTCNVIGGNPKANISWSCEPRIINSQIADLMNTATSSITVTVLKEHNGKACTCEGRHLLWMGSKLTEHIFLVYYAPYPTFNITQIPPGPVNVTDVVILTCEIYGGNPQATIFWTCEEPIVKVVTTTESPSTEKSSSSIQLTVTKEYNGRVCTCTGSHPVWVSNITANHVLHVQYPPTSGPVITQTPITPNIEGTTVTVVCSVFGGNPLPTISWSCDAGIPVTATVGTSNNSVTSSFSVTLSKASNGLVCTCEGKHLLWNDSRIYQHLFIVNYAPQSNPNIIQTPAGPVNESAVITLACTINGGNPLAKIFWSCNGSVPVLTNGIHDNSTITSSVQMTVTKDFNGRICICTGSHPVWIMNRSVNHSLNVQYPPPSAPNITLIPSSPSIEGSIVTVKCDIFGGNPVANITWICDPTIPVTQTVTESINNVRSSFNVTVIRTFNGLTCTCQGRHLLWNDTKKHQHNFTVYYSPVVKISRLNTFQLVETENLFLICEVLQSNPKVNSFSWYKNISMSSLGHEENFTVIKVNRSDAGYYRCEASNGIGVNGTDTVYIYVFYKPAIRQLSILPESKIEENETAVLQCIIDSNPPSNVTWTYNRNDLPVYSNTEVLQSNYTIRNATCFETGYYRCNATNVLKNINYSDHRDVQLFVICSPRIDTRFGQPINKIGLAVGKDLKLQLDIIAYPQPLVEWWFRTNENSTNTIVTSNSSELKIFQHQVVYEKSNVTVNDFGLYSVFVQNGYGDNVTYQFNVIPQGPPDKSSQINASCGILNVEIFWTTEYNGGEKQHFYILMSDQSGQMTIHNTNLVGIEKGEKKSITISSIPREVSIQVFGNHSFGNATSDKYTCQVKGLPEANEQSVTGIAAGTGSTAAVLIIVIIVVIFILRKRKGSEKKADTGRILITSTDTDKDHDELKDNVLYVSCGSDLQPKMVTSQTERPEVEGKANADFQETAFYSTVNKQNTTTDKMNKNGHTKDNKAKAKQKGKHNTSRNDEVYENVVEQKPTLNKSQNLNQDGLQYAELVFNPSANGARFIVHGMENRAIYATVDTSQRIDPLPESDDDKEKT